MPVIGNEAISNRCDDDEIICSEFEPDCLEPAAYELRVATTEAKIDEDIYTERDVEYKTSDNLPRVFELPPRKISVISSKEELAIPEDLCARVGIRLELARKGLIPLFGPQIDPGYEGRFYGVVYNASGKPIELHKNMRVFKMELRRTHNSNHDAEIAPYRSIDELDLQDVDHGVTDLEDVTTTLEAEIEDFEDAVRADIDGLNDEIDKLQNEEIEQLRNSVHEVKRGYTQVVLFGVFLLATTVFGVVFTIIMSSIRDNSLNFGLNMSTVLTFFFIGGWIVTTAIIVLVALEPSYNGD